MVIQMSQDLEAMVMILMNTLSTATNSAPTKMEIPHTGTQELVSCDYKEPSVC